MDDDLPWAAIVQQAQAAQIIAAAIAFLLAEDRSAVLEVLARSRVTDRWQLDPSGLARHLGAADPRESRAFSAASVIAEAVLDARR